MLSTNPCPQGSPNCVKIWFYTERRWFAAFIAATLRPAGVPHLLGVPGTEAASATEFGHGRPRERAALAPLNGRVRNYEL